MDRAVAVLNQIDILQLDAIPLRLAAATDSHGTQINEKKSKSSKLQKPI